LESSWNTTSWIDNISPTSGVSNNSDDNTMIIITLNSTNLLSGIVYECDIQIDTNDTTNGPSFTFSISMIVSADVIDLTSPESNEVWYAGSAHNITWVYEDVESEDMNISLYKNGNYVMTLTESATNVGTGINNWTWAVPYSIISSNAYSIKVSDISNNTYGYSSYFSIVSPGGFVDNETVEPVDGQPGVFTITVTNHDLTGCSVLIEMWDNGDDLPKAKIWILYSDSLLGSVISSDGEVQMSLDGGWFIYKKPSLTVKKSPSYHFTDDTFAIRLNQIVVSDDSISSATGNDVNIYSSLFNDYNRESSSSYYINLYFGGEDTSVWGDYLLTNYPSEFSYDEEENRLSYTPSNSDLGCNIVLMNTILQVKLKYKY